MNTYMGIDIGGTKIAYGLFDENRRLIQRKQVPADAGADGPAFFSDVARQIKELISDLTARGDQLKGIGIGITGFVDFERGALTVTASLPRLNNFCVVDYLRAELKTDIPILMDNDCHCGALAEYRRGAGQGHRHMLYCPISTGTSTGIIIDGKLFRGSNGASGETGHTLSAVQGELRDVHACACGNSGCFNSLGSGKAITFHILHWLEQGETSIMPELAGGAEKINAKHIDAAYEMGDALAIRAVEQMAHYLGIWVFNAYMTFNIDCIVFSGGLLKMGDKLYKRILENFEKYHTNGFPVEFHKTELGSDSGLIGAVELLF